MATKLHPGDKVQELHGSVTGVVKAVLPNGKLLVNTEEWDRMEYFESELIKIDSPKEETQSSEKDADIQKVESSFSGEDGIWLGFVSKQNSELCNLLVRNQTSVSIFMHFMLKPGTAEGRSIFKEIIHSGKEVLLYEFLPPIAGTGELWEFQIVYLTNGVEHSIPPLVTTKRFRPKDYKKSKDLAGAICWFTCLKPDDIGNDTELSKNSSDARIIRPPRIVDLHMEKIIDAQSRSLMTDSDILREQNNAFKKALDLAIATNMDSIIFIHGIGSGILKQNIEDFVNANDYPVELHTKPASEKEYGVGAIEIFIG